MALSHLYKALVLPKLDYCSSVWDSHAVILIDRLESVQRFAAKLCMKQWSDPPPPSHPVADITKMALPSYPLFQAEGLSSQENY